MNSLPVTSIIVTYHSADVIDQTMQAARQSYDAGLAQCIVVDNASGDQTVDHLRSEHPWAQVVASPRNLGYGRGCNLGLEMAQTPYVMFMNPDAIVPPDALRELIRFMEEHPQAGMIAPSLVHDDGTPQVAGGLPTPRLFLRRAAGRGWPAKSRRVITPGGAPFQTNWLCGAVLFARRAFMEQIGGFDPRFFLYFEETDLCRRVLAAGAELWAVGAARALHLGGASAKNTHNSLYSGCISQHYFQSRFYYLAKHYGYPVAAATDLGEMLLLSIREVPMLLLGKSRGDLRTRWQAPFMRMPARE